MGQFRETEEGVHPSETPLCGQHDNQTKAQSPEQQQKPDSQVLSKPMERYESQCAKRSSAPHTSPLLVPTPATSASLSPRLDSSESLFSHLLKDVATSDDDSVHSSHSGISLERKVSSGSIDMSRKRRKTESYAHSSTFKKKCTYVMGRFEETEEGVHPSETPLCGQHDNQTKAQSTSPLLVRTPSTSASAPVTSPLLVPTPATSASAPHTSLLLVPTPATSASVPDIPMMCTGGPFRAAASLPTLDSGESSSSDSEDVATSDDDSDQSSHSRISLESQASSGSSCVSNQSKRSIDNYTDFKTKENEKTSPPPPPRSLLLEVVLR